MERLEELLKDIYDLDKDEQLILFSFLDTMRNQLTKEQYLHILEDIYDNADEIFNDIQKHLTTGMEKLEEMSNSAA